MRVLIVKLSSLGDVLHAAPVVHDILRSFPEAIIDWVVEPGFSPLVRRINGVDQVIECALRRWVRAWWTSAVRAEQRAFLARLRHEHYDAIIDLQGLTKSAIVTRLACGVSYGLANRTEGSSHEAPARWLVTHAIRVRPRIHAVDRSRELAGCALGYRVEGPPIFGLCGSSSRPMHADAPTAVFVHGSSREDKLWPEASWIEFGREVLSQGWRIALPNAGAVELARAQRLATALGERAEVWPATTLDQLVDGLGRTQGVVGVDSGLSHIAVALGLPHVQIYNFATSWRTGPQSHQGRHHQLAVERQPMPTVNQVLAAWVKTVDPRRTGDPPFEAAGPLQACSR